MAAIKDTRSGEKWVSETGYYTGLAASTRVDVEESRAQVSFARKHRVNVKVATSLVAESF